METNAPLEVMNQVGKLSWASSPVAIEPGTKVQRNGKDFIVLRCEHLGLTPESEEWSLALLEPPEVEFVDGMKKLLDHLPE